MKKLAGLFLIIFLLALACPAQTPEVVFFAVGSVSRPGTSHIQPASDYNYTFRFTADNNNTDINGRTYTRLMNMTETDPNCCFYGKRFAVSDSVQSEFSSLGYNTGTVKVDGYEYPSMGFDGMIRFTGSALVPFYLKKKQTAVIRVNVTVNGYLDGYPIVPRHTLRFPPLFHVVLNNLKGVATYTIRRHDMGAPGMENHFDIVSVTYELTSYPPYI